MEIKKRLLMTLVLFAMICTLGWADDYSYLTVQQNDEGYTESSVALSSLSKITFSDGAMQLYDASGTSLGNYTLSALNKMFFSATATDIQTTDADKLSFAFSGDVLKVDAAAGSRISLFRTSGTLVKSFTAAADESEVNMSTLSKGVYLLKVNDKVGKVLNK